MQFRGGGRPPAPEMTKPGHREAMAGYVGDVGVPGHTPRPGRVASSFRLRPVRLLGRSGCRTGQREPRRPPTRVPAENAAAPAVGVPEDRVWVDAVRVWVVCTGVEPVPPRRA